MSQQKIANAVWRIVGVLAMTGTTLCFAQSERPDLSKIEPWLKLAPQQGGNDIAVQPPKDHDTFLGVKLGQPLVGQLPDCKSTKPGNKCYALQKSPDTDLGRTNAVMNYPPDLGVPYEAHIELLDDKVMDVYILTGYAYESELFKALVAKYGKWAEETNEGWIWPGEKNTHIVATHPSFMKFSVTNTWLPLKGVYDARIAAKPAKAVNKAASAL
jgi:hypothetical protein